MSKQKTMDDWEDKYTLDPTVVSKEQEPAGRFETYGEDVDYIQKLNQTDPKRIWTMVDCDGGSALIAGYHFVNRICYEVSREDWESKEESYYLMDDDWSNPESYEDYLVEKGLPESRALPLSACVGALHNTLCHLDRGNLVLIKELFGTQIFDQLNKYAELQQGLDILAPELVRSEDV